MKSIIKTLVLVVLLLGSGASSFLQADDKPAASAAPAASYRVRYLPFKGHEQDVVGGKFFVSNMSPTAGFQEMAEIKAAPAEGQWGELQFHNVKPYRWIKYLAPRGSYGRIAKLEFYAGDRRLKSQDIVAGLDPGAWRGVLRDGANPMHQGSTPDNQYFVLDVGDEAAGPAPFFSPGNAESMSPIKVAILSKRPSGVIRYTLDGTLPTLENSQVYTAPLAIDKTTTIRACSFVNGLAPSRDAFISYIIGAPRHREIFHLGNSLTGITGSFSIQARTAGAVNDSRWVLIGGGLTKALWNATMEPIGDPADKERWIDLYSTRVGQTIIYSRDQMQKAANEWKKVWPTITTIDDMTFQPRDFDIAEEADYENRFLKVIQQKAPQVQPWLYIEWDERNRQRPTDLAKEPTSEMKTVYPALTWEESMAAMILYGEDLKRKVNETYKGAKAIRTIPVALAMGWIHHMIEEGQMPGFAKDDFYPKLFGDAVHTNIDGSFLVDCMFYAAFYGESPEGKFLPVRTSLTAPQARVMQRLAWDAFKNYPGSGLYVEGTVPAAKPQFSPAPAPIDGVTRVTLSSSTPDAWFRYTLDGTPPTHTNGYIYCGVISVRPGMTLKAVAYKSGAAESPITEAAYPAATP